MKLLFATLLLLASFKVCSAQSGYLNYRGRGQDLTEFLRQNVRPVPVTQEKCLMPFTYIKFKVTQQNTIDSLIISNNDVEDVRKEISRVMALTAGYWDLEKVKDKWFVVPLISYTAYNGNFREKGCDFKQILADQNRQMNYENKEKGAIYFPLVLIQANWQQ